MDQPKASKQWLMPWLSPLVFGGAYLFELWREELLDGSFDMLVQFVLAAPLIVAGSVLFSTAEQQARTHSLTPAMRAWLRWTPRVVLLGLVGFLALLSLDVLEGRTAGDIALGLLMHNIPALGLLAAASAAWRWPWVGALALVAFAAWWLSLSGGRFFPSVALLLAVTALTVAALFLLSWLLDDFTTRQRRPLPA